MPKYRVIKINKYRYLYAAQNEMDWEDSDKIEFISLEAAGLENRDYDNLGFSFFDNYFIEEM